MSVKPSSPWRYSGTHQSSWHRTKQMRAVLPWLRKCHEEREDGLAICGSPASSVSSAPKPSSLNSGAPTLIDASGDITGRVYGVFGPPTFYFVDRRGELVGRAAGARPWNSAAGRAFVQQLLEVRQ